jgi:hypothetical protein
MKTKKSPGVDLYKSRDVFAGYQRFAKFGVCLWGLAIFVLIAAFSSQRICSKLLQLD